MPVIIKIEGENANHALSELKDLANGIWNSNHPVIAAVPAPSGVVAPVAETPVTPPPVQEVAEEAPKAKRTTKKTAEIKAPEAPTPEVKAQDKADEVAEAAAKSTGELTHDDVRNAIADYIKAVGLEVALANQASIIGVSNVAEIPNTQEALKKAILALTAVTEAGEVEPDEVPTFTRDDVKAAMIAYAKKYDVDQANLPFTQTDVPATLKSLFDGKVSKLSEIPDDQASLRKAVLGIRGITEANPYGRKAVA